MTMRPVLLTGFCVLLSASLACNDDGPPTGEGATETNGDGDPGDGDPGDGDPGDGDPGDGDPGDGDPGDGDPGDGDPGDGDPGDGDPGDGDPGDGDPGDGDPSGVCDPAPGDDACDECVKDSCCDRLTACMEDAGCVCVLECVEADEGDSAQCHTQCGAEQPIIAFGQLLGCTQAMCAAECL
jgi:hypothetical protein